MNKERQESAKKKIDYFPAVVSVIIVLALSAALFIGGNDVALVIEQIKIKTTAVLTPAYLWLGLIVVGCCLFFVFSKYGDIRLGAEAPDYKTLPWLFMIFCCGMGSSMQYWAAIEWLYYYSAPPMGAEPFSRVAAELSTTYTNFHWTITPWACYCVGFLALALRVYVKKKSDFTLTGCIEYAIGERRASGWIGKIVNTLFILAIISIVCPLLAFGIPMISNNFAELVGISDTFSLQITMIAFITLIYTISSIVGLRKGLQVMSKVGAYGAILLALYFLIAGPTLFELKTATTSLGSMFQNYIHMSLWTDHIGNSGFPEAWTAFYWAWWIGCGPIMWIFIAKVSKGRTVRQTILGVVGCGSLGCALYFNTVGATGLYQQLNGIQDYVSILNTQGPTAVISTLIASIPLGKAALLLWFIVAVLLLTTSLDGNVYTISSAMTKNLRSDQDPPRALRLFWSIFVCLVPLAFLFANAPLQAIQSTTVIMAVPISVIMILSMYASVKMAKDGYGKMSRDDIKALNGATPPAFLEQEKETSAES